MNLESISSQSLNKEMAYLFGVYITDAQISTDNKFQLQVIDKDFAEQSLNFVKKIKPDCKGNVYERMNSKGKWNKRIQYCINVGFTEFSDFFRKQTNYKHHIPYIIWEAPLIIKKWFIAGVLDGDGWITYHTRPNGNKQWTIGIGKSEDGWILEFRDFLQENGIRIYKHYRSLTKNGVPFIKFNLYVDSFLERGLFFTIKRKQERLELLRKVQRLDAVHPTG